MHKFIWKSNKYIKNFTKSLDFISIDKLLCASWACILSVVTTFEYYKNQISNLDFGRYVNLAVEVIEQLNLSQIYKTKLKQLDVGIIDELKNSRSENFLFQIDKKVINVY